MVYVFSKEMRIAIGQINTSVGDLEKNTTKIIEYYKYANVANIDLIAFPELSLTGYPIKDMVLRQSFLDHCKIKLAEIIEVTAGQNCGILIGLPLKEDGETYNAAALIHDGKIVDLTRKVYLPNHGIFDEGMYFTTGSQPKTFRFKGKNIGVAICYDMWFDDLPRSLKEQEAEIIISMNSSPYVFKKHYERKDIVQSTAAKYNIPIIYVNQFGAQDNIVFDGGSFAVDSAGRVTVEPQFWTEELIFSNWDGKHNIFSENYVPDKYEDMEHLYNAMMKGLKDYVIKNGFQKVLVGLSGGIDSALTATIAADALGPENLICVRMPSEYSSDHSLDDAKELYTNLECIAHTIPINSIHNKVISVLDPIIEQVNRQDTTEENVQSRIRGLLLMALSNKFDAMLLATGNKSEAAVGYSTLYGDTCGSIGPIGDLYKTEVYKVAKWRNTNIPRKAKVQKKDIIPENSIFKAPSAELKPMQFDQDTLPPYNVLDKILYQLIEQNASIEEICISGLDKDLVIDIAKMLQKSEYKRSQSSPSIKVSKLLLSGGRRYPITNNYAEWDLL